MKAGGPLAPVLFILLAASSPAAVLIVDGAGGSGVYTSPQSAFDAAADGDIVLIRAGNYINVHPFFGWQTPFVTSQKSLTILADPPGAAVTLTGLRINGLGQGKRLVLRGIDLAYTATAFPHTDHQPALTVGSSAGTIWIEDATLAGADGSVGGHISVQAPPALLLTSASVTLVRCAATGGTGYAGDIFNPAGTGGPSATVNNSTLAAFDSQFIGGLAGSGPGGTHAGGAGAILQSSHAMLSGCAVIGGSSADGVEVNAASTLEWIDSTFAGGAAAIDAAPGTVQSWSGVARSFAVTAPVHSLQPFAIEIQGVVGDRIFVFWSMLGAQLPIAGVKAEFVLGAPLLGPADLGTISDPAGQWALIAIAPSLVPQTIAGAVFLAQPICVNGTEIVAASGSAFVLLQ